MGRHEAGDVLSYIRKESIDMYNRLHSIAEDVEFVRQVHDAYPKVPLLPNLRCGAWYTNPDIATHIPAYFKSTDGHFNNWSFNLRRANIHLLELIADSHAMILVDSTRSGKRIPDALSKTVPIWCAVINRAMVIRYPELKNVNSCLWDGALYTPPAAVSPQEHHQIEQHLDPWARELADSSFIIPKLPNPLRPLWITPATTTFPNLIGDFSPVLCVSASKRVDQGVERRSNNFSYVQGSGDDHELWGMGLTPPMFWNHYKELLSTSRDRLVEVVGRLVQRESAAAILDSSGGMAPTPISKIGGRLLLCDLKDLMSLPPTGADNVTYLILTPSGNHQNTPSRTYVPVVSGKRGQAHFLIHILPTSIDHIRKCILEDFNICIACETGRDLSVGVVTAALQLFFNDDGSLRLSTESSSGADGVIANKQSIRTRLQWVIASRPEANPSRSTLKRVNEFILTQASFRRTTPVR